jgi:uncharacterized protein YgbK (DUF1537 family)
VVRLAILADDLTGAADAGGGFARAGLTTTLVFGGDPAHDAEVLVRSTGSRGLPVEEAVAVNREMAAGIPEHALTYKKIDSMLRGHPCAELGAVLDGRNEWRALVAPALPVQRRTTVGGYQRIGGSSRTVDLMATFGYRPDLPAKRIDLWTVQQGGDAVTRAIEMAGSGLLVADAVTDADLAAIAHGVLTSGIRVVAGTAGLALQLAVALSGNREAGPAPALRSVPVLVVAASRHPATAAQVDALAAAAVAVGRPSQALLDGDEPDHIPVVREMDGMLAAGRSVVLTTVGTEASRRGGAFVSAKLAEIVAGVAQRHEIGGLVLTGGDVAAAVLARLGAREIALGGEVRPAIPWGTVRSGLLPDIPVVTKAGSFGDPDALLDSLRFLRGCTSG